MTKTNYMMTAEEVAEELGISKGHAYKIVRSLNQELQDKGFIVVAGKVLRAFWETKFFSYTTRQSLAQGGKKMPAYRDEERKTWTANFRYTDWMGKQQRKVKRGFKTKREALASALQNAPSTWFWQAPDEVLSLSQANRVF